MGNTGAIGPLQAGFKLRELVIKRQHNCKTTGFWYANSIKYNFLLLAHEYLPIFEKPKTKIPLVVGEKGIDSSLPVTILEKSQLVRKLDKFETTTVWIFPKEDFEERLNKNVIDRYSNGRDYSIINFDSHLENDKNFTERKIQKCKDLLFIKSSYLSNNLSRSNIEYYLKKIEKIIISELPNIIKGGFMVIQAKDVRIDKYLEPIAKRLIDMLILDNLWLKEIVIVAEDKRSPNIDNSLKYLDITHQYLLVFEKNR